MIQESSRRYWVLDIETAGGNFSRIPSGFQLLVVGIKCEGQHWFYRAPLELPKLLEDLRHRFVGTLVTFNGKRFDLPILNEHLRRAVGRTMEVPRHYDILDEINRVVGRTVSLADLAQATLGETKTPWDHSQNLHVWGKDSEHLIEHNRIDLDLTGTLYEFIISRKPLKVGNRDVMLPGPT